MANKRISFESVIGNQNRPVNPLFLKTDVPPKIIARTFRLPADLVKALDLYAAAEGKDKSEIVRMGLEKIIPDSKRDEARKIIGASEQENNSSIEQVNKRTVTTVEQENHGSIEQMNKRTARTAEQENHGSVEQANK